MTSGFITLSEETLKKLEQTGFRIWHLISSSNHCERKRLRNTSQQHVGFPFPLEASIVTLLIAFGVARKIINFLFVAQTKNLLAQFYQELTADKAAFKPKDK